MGRGTDLCVEVSPDSLVRVRMGMDLTVNAQLLCVHPPDVLQWPGRTKQARSSTMGEEVSTRSAVVSIVRWTIIQVAFLAWIAAALQCGCQVRASPSDGARAYLGGLGHSAECGSIAAIPGRVAGS